MTLSVVVACENGFYLITDTLTLDEQTKTYTLNTKKFSCSKNHKMAVCFSGDAVVPDCTDNKKEAYSTTYLIERFFESIDVTSPLEIKKINSVEIFVNQILYFIKKIGDGYFDQFKDYVSLFLGIIVDDKVIVGSFSKNEVKEFTYSKTSLNQGCCYFTNCPKALDLHSKNIVMDSKCPITGASEQEKQNKLFSEPAHRKVVFSHIIPLARRALIEDYQQPIVGKYFEYTLISKSDITLSSQFEVDCAGDGSKGLSPSFETITDGSFPKYEIMKTKKEYLALRDSNKINSYDFKGILQRIKPLQSPAHTQGTTFHSTSSNSTVSSPASVGGGSSSSIQSQLSKVTFNFKEIAQLFKSLESPSHTPRTMFHSTNSSSNSSSSSTVSSTASVSGGSSSSTQFTSSKVTFNPSS